MAEPGGSPASPRRAAVEAALDRTVRNHRLTLAVTVPAVGAVVLLAGSRGLLPGEVVRHPVLLVGAVAAMRLPLVAGLLPAVDRRAAAGLGLVAAFAYAVEFVGVRTGLPYGEFAYTADLGPMLAGAVPLALPLLYLPLVVGAVLLARALLGPLAARRPVRVVAGVAGLLAIDLVLDPGAVAVGFWAYAEPGWFYGVPLSNFAGWVLTGTVAVVGVDLALDPAAVDGRLEPYVLDDLVSFVVLWGGVNLGAGNWLAVVVALGLAGGLAVGTDRLGLDPRPVGSGPTLR